jgi:hypothetical protein
MVWNQVVNCLRHLRRVQVKLQVPLHYPGFPVQIGGVGKFRAAFFTENGIRDLVRHRDVGNSGPLRSQARRGGRDDKFEGGGPPRHEWMDRV